MKDIMAVGPGTPISNEDLEQAINAADKSVAGERVKVESAQLALLAAERELILLIELARLRGGTQFRTTGSSVASGSSDQPEMSRITYGREGRSNESQREAVIRIVVDILRTNGDSMPIRALMTEATDRGAPIPGRGEQANLISVITRAPEIVRPQRGFYGLAEWNMALAAAEQPPLGKRSAKRRRAKGTRG